MELKAKRIKLTLFGVTLSHTAAAATALDRSQNAVHIRSPAPLLMGEDLDSELLLARLNQTDIREHTLVLECARKLGRDGRVAVQTGQRDKLQDESVKISSLDNQSSFTLTGARQLDTHPSLARSQMNDFSDASSKPWPIQLNDGERL